MAISPARLAANRANARRSTGPRTPSGKAVSSMNAVRHGLLAQRVLLADESMDEYEELAARVLEALAPASAMQEIVAADVVAILWRLQRLQRVEVALFSIGMPIALQRALSEAGEADYGIGASFASQAHAFATLTRYETSLVNRLRQTMADLERLQTSRESDDADIVVIPRSV